MYDDKNFVISPLSAHAASIMAGTGANNKTSEEIWNVMKLSHFWQIKYRDAYSLIINQLKVSVHTIIAVLFT